MRRAASLLAFVGVLALPGAGTSAPGGTWVGSFRLPAAAEPVALSVAVSGRKAVAALGPGHVAQATVVVRGAGGRLQLRLPGRPAVVLDGRLRAGRITGTVRQGALRGTFTLRRGRAGEWGRLGLYRLADGRHVAIGPGRGSWRAYGVDDGEVRGLYATAPGAYDLGAGLAVRRPSAGSVRFDAAGLSWQRGADAPLRGTRLALRQLEVRFPSGGALLAGTLTLPIGPGPHPAVALVHGSGPSPRQDAGFQAGFYLRHGIAVLAYDKRGIGQSGGTYPGEFASETTIDRLARDAEAAARFLAAQPELDRARIGLSGASQAGWIMPLAATREAAIRFLVLLVSPTVTQGESDFYSQLTTQGASIPDRSPAQIEAEVRRQGPSGFDPLPAIRALRVPALWLYGGNDQHVPTRLSIERLDPLTREPGRDLSYSVLPGGNHGLLETEHGLNDEALRSSSFAQGLMPAIADWLSEHGLAGGRSPVALRAKPAPPLRERCVTAAERKRAVGFAAADGTRLAGVVLGGGRRGVVLAHQGASTLCSWLPFARRLAAAGHLVLDLDLRGYGSSARARTEAGTWRVDLDVRAAVRELRRRGARSVVLMGASLGGLGALAAAPAIVPPVSGIVSLSSAARYATVDALAAMPRLRVPALFVAARDDRDFAADATALHAAAASPEKELLVVPGSAHGVPLLRAAAVRTAVQAFVRHASS